MVPKKLGLEAKGLNKTLLRVIALFPICLNSLKEIQLLGLLVTRGIWQGFCLDFFGGTDAKTLKLMKMGPGVMAYVCKHYLGNGDW
jgi:hypothetical protein